MVCFEHCDEFMDFIKMEHLDVDRDITKRHHTKRSVEKMQLIYKTTRMEGFVREG